MVSLVNDQDITPGEQVFLELQAALRERDAAKAELEELRLICALQGVGVDPDGFYSSTPGARVRHLLAVEGRYEEMQRLFIAQLQATRDLDDLRMKEIAELRRELERLSVHVL